VLAAHVGLIGLAWALSSALLYLRTKETIQSETTVRVHAGSRDRLFFGWGWHRPKLRGAITVRTSKRSGAALFLPLTKGRSYALDFRVDPVSNREGPTFLSVCANGVHVTGMAIERNADRVGSYTVRLPASAVENGRNRVDLLTSAAPHTDCNRMRDGDAAVMFWFVRVRPMRDALSRRFPPNSM